ncbi:MAG TPA: CcmD family protein [Bacteroidia bacterium]|nr:CcmD family protein [Bacteroidia bacterium]
MRNIRFILLLLMVLCSGSLFAQETVGNVEMADGLRSSGKIYVVVSVVLIILAGLLMYLISIDRKVNKMEKNIEAENQLKE